MPFNTLKQLVAANSGENDIQNHLKANLHLIGRSCTYTPIGDEYLAFSEFEIQRGKVDFCVFADRSRMAVVLIEVKGADFSFLNQDGSINALISEAARQIRERVEYAMTDQFRQEAHEIRRLTLLDRSPFNHVKGPAGLPEVDPGKPLQIRSLVIGGFTRDDTEESRERNRLERHDPKTRFESWNSWIRKNGDIGGSLKNAGH
ncbi:DUF4263 domain-containing protein [Xanthomonas campestris pv. phormiicola]|nr:DUF4263 domain-containing protein [Xanthomonas campestris pv. phormiicola]UYC15133.1 DUF4263 domain-containing protein [Xanthomonas campestris pv. phormiicola]